MMYSAPTSAALSGAELSGGSDWGDASWWWAVIRTTEDAQCSRFPASPAREAGDKVAVRMDRIVCGASWCEYFIRPVGEASNFLVVAAITGLPPRHGGIGGRHINDLGGMKPGLL